MKEYSTIIWDFNGTLVDDVRASLGAVNDMLKLRNQNPIDLDTYYGAVDTPIWKFYEKVFKEGTITPQEAMLEFDTGYEKHLEPDPLMEGAVEILEYFKILGKHQIVVSASHVDKVKSRLAEFGLINYFDAVLAHSDYNAGDKTELAKEYLLKIGIEPQSVLVIGDCVSDYNVAKGIGATCVLNTNGHQSRREFATTDAIVIDSFIELKSIIN